MSEEVWNVLTMRDGVVSLLKNLTEYECRAVMQRILGGDPWSQHAIHYQVLASQPHSINQQNYYAGHARAAAEGWSVQRCECWGSLGSKLEVWPKPDDYDARLAEAFKVAALVKATNEAMDRKAA